MNKTRIIIGLSLLLILLFNFTVAVSLERTPTQIKPREESKTEGLSDANPKTTNEVPQTPSSLPTSANFIMVADVLDGFGGQRYNNACDLSFFAGGQSSPIGAGSSTHFKLYAGFIYPTVVLCGDVNKDGVVQLGDLVYLISYLFRSGPSPDPLQAGDVNCDGNVNLLDVVYLIAYLYKSGPPPHC